MYTRIVGDIHGMFNDYRAFALHGWDGPSIQIGDFGIGFGQSDYWLDTVKQHQSDKTHRFIRGNHDNPAICKTMPGFIKDGTVEGHTMFIGGAWSIDNPTAPPGWYRRTVDVNWWEDEECSAADFDLFLDIYATIKPRVMITHDFPREASHYMFFKTGLVKGIEYPNRTGIALQRMFIIHQPDYWFAGHWHHTTHLKLGNTHFQCIGELDYVDFDLETLEFAP